MSISDEMVASFAARDPSPCLFHSLTSSFFFKGVYLTSLDPRLHVQKEILINNYDDAGQVQRSERLWAKPEWVVELKMDKNEVEKIKNSKGDVYLHEGDIDLKKCQEYSIYKNPITQISDNGQITLYHYTNKAGADGIAENGVIKTSTEETPIQNRRHGCGKSLVC